MMMLTGQNALITGASSGIGRAISLRLAAQGVNVLLLGRDQSRLQQVADEAAEHGITAITYRTDFSKDEDVTELRDIIKSRFKQLDILVHSAGAFSMGSIEAATIGELDQQYRVNVRVPYFLNKVLVPLIIPCKGQVVFINSSAGILAARANVAQYAATKHALRALADSLRDEVNDKGVRVLSVYPGRTASAMQAAIHEKEGREYHPGDLMQPDDVATVVLTALMLPKTAEMTDVSIRPMNKLKG